MLQTDTVRILFIMVFQPYRVSETLVRLFIHARASGHRNRIRFNVPISEFFDIF